MPPSRPDYTRQRGLENHPGTILALTLTADGKTLVTGGSAGTRAWDVKRLSMMARPATAGVQGATTVLLCVRRVDEPVNVIYNGTANGYIFCWRNCKGKWEETFTFQIDEPKDITGIAFDASTNRLIICSSGGRVVAWGAIRDESNRVHMSKVFSRKIEDFEPRAITFAGFDSSKDKDILLFGENHTGPMWKTGEVVEEWTVGSPIGNAQVDWKEGVVLFDNIFTGPSLWRYHDYMRVKMYFISATRNYGRIRNTVATAEVDGVSTVFAAPTRSEDGDVELCVWKQLEPEPEATPSTFWKTIWSYLVRIIVACCCIGFLVQNLQGLLGTTVIGAANITAEAQEVGRKIIGPVLNGEL
ncbi:hypothetical protein K438DRAFT_1973724 [Mycena galopus ATCC 62051]|nr:hypothetical protein K438DRAFT_1973724 [Mycena galopus ATCC 62051]